MPTKYYDDTLRVDPSFFKPRMNGAGLISIPEGSHLSDSDASTPNGQLTSIMHELTHSMGTIDDNDGAWGDWGNAHNLESIRDFKEWLIYKAAYKKCFKQCHC